MINKNEEYIVDIIDNGFQGEGIAKIDNFPIFIQHAVKGEKIKIKILKVQTNFAFGRIIEIIEKSDKRLEPECITYKQCGGCNLRHIEYEETLKIKKEIVENCLKKSIKKEIKINKTIGMEEPFYYRNKLQYPVGIDKENNPIMGVFSQRSHNIVSTKNCYIQSKICQDIANDVFNFIKENNISVYNEKTLKGTLRHIVIRVGVKTNEVLVTLVVNDNNFKNYKEFIHYITNKYSEIKSIVKNYNNKNTNVILGNKNEVIYGKGYIYDILGEYKFKISPLSFYQVNPIQTEVLYNTVINYVNGSKNQKDESQSASKNIALDLYCGIGTIGIFVSKYFDKVYGIEIVKQAIEDAKENAKINNINNMEFYMGDVEEVLPPILEKTKIKPNVIFVDPPRKGLNNNTVETLLKLETKKIIYVSCNPATLARDLAKMENRYEIKEIQPIDMFPFTVHVECVVVLGLKQN